MGEPRRTFAAILTGSLVVTSGAGDTATRTPGATTNPSTAGPGTTMTPTTTGGVLKSARPDLTGESR